MTRSSLQNRIASWLSIARCKALSFCYSTTELIRVALTAVERYRWCVVTQKAQVQSLDPESTHDQNGVDRTLIREMLLLSPQERLARVEGLVEELIEVWELNGTRPVR